MKQSSFRYLGAFDLALVALFVAVFGARTLTSSVVVAGMAIAGAFALLAGSVAAVSIGPVSASWRHFVGATYAIFGLILPASYAPSVVAGTATQAEIGLFLATSVGAFSLLFYGYDIVRGGDHFDVELDVETVVGR